MVFFVIFLFQFEDPSSDGVTIKMPYGVDVLHRPDLHATYSYWAG